MTVADTVVYDAEGTQIEVTSEVPEGSEYVLTSVLPAVLQWKILLCIPCQRV